MIMPASQNRSNYAFRRSFLRLVTKPTAKSGLNDDFVKSPSAALHFIATTKKNSKTKIYHEEHEEKN